MPLTYRIHPAIGIARVGDSPDGFFIGPEAPGVVPSLATTGATGPTGKYKDSQQRIKRQGARFRIFEYTQNDAGATTRVREVTAAEAHIEWQVHLANRKSAAPSFPRGPRRNQQEPEGRLIIDAGLQAIGGASQAGRELKGRFMDVDVQLGVLMTDEAGGLIVLGGFGQWLAVLGGRALND